MADSAFWRNLGAKFRDISDPNDAIRAEFTEVGTRDRIWKLQYGSGGSYDSAQHFLNLATIGGQALAGESADFRVWLSFLRERLHVYDLRSFMHVHEDGTEEPWSGGTIHQVVRKSVDQCGILELQEQKKEWIIERSPQAQLRQSLERQLERTQQSQPISNTMPSPQNSAALPLSPERMQESFDRLLGSTPEEREITRARALEILSGNRRNVLGSKLPDTREGDSDQEPADNDPVVAERRALLNNFKAKGRILGIKITDEMIAKVASPGKWNDRTRVTWWKRNDPRIKPPHDRKIRTALSKDPLSLWKPTIRRKPSA